MNGLINDIHEDALTHFLSRVRFDAQIFKHQSYCGEWAIDTSGSGRVPFHLIDKGSAWVHMEGSEPQQLQAGDLVLIPHDLSHTISNASTPPDSGLINTPVASDSGTSFTSILCGYYIFESISAEVLLSDLPDLVILLNARNNPLTNGVGHIIDATLLEVDNNYPGRTLALCDLARLMLLHLLRGRFAEELSTGFLAALGDPKISQALLLIHTRFNEAWTLEGLARDIGMSRTSFANKFHQYIGIPPVKYLTAWRMQEATTLLKTSTLSVDKIAEQCGYQSAASFRKAFKCNTGKTPKQVRSNKPDTLFGRATDLLLGGSNNCPKEE
ncbi:MAG: AraC family transcriptional regulator [Candidatus Thiodiazotropha sp. (ex. Lucinoma kazani)]